MRPTNGSDRYSDKYETLADRKFADQAGPYEAGFSDGSFAAEEYAMGREPAPPALPDDSEYIAGFDDGYEEGLVKAETEVERQTGMRENKMKISKRQLRKIILEEVENLEYELSKGTTDDAFFAEHPEDVEAQEDSWAGGQNIHNQVDHTVAGGGEETTRGIESTKITEAQLKRIIREAMREEIILDYEKISSDQADYIISQLNQGGVSVRPGGAEVFEERPGLVSVAVLDEYMLTDVIEILGEPVAER